jgi:hypothetical protein
MSCIRMHHLCRSTSRWSAAMALTMHLVTVSRGSTTCRLVAPAVLRPCRSSGRAISPPDFSLVGRTGCRRAPHHSVVRHKYSSPGRTGSTSTTSRVRVSRLLAQLVVDYFAYAMWQRASSPRASRRQLFCLCHVSRTGLTSTTRRPVAPALLRPCRASGHAVSMLDFFSVGRTGSHRAPGHSFSRLDLLFGRTCSTSAMPCIATTCLTSTPTLPRLRRVPPGHHLATSSALPRLRHATSSSDCITSTIHLD